MWATTVTPAAKALDIRPDRLSGWMRVKRFEFEGVPYPYFDPDPRVLQPRRLYPEPWLVAVAAELRIKIDWEAIPPAKRIEIPDDSGDDEG